MTNPQSLNRYGYVTNNPTTLTDPSGLGPCDSLDSLDCGPPCDAFDAEGCQNGCNPVWADSCVFYCYELGTCNGRNGGGGGGSSGGTGGGAPPPPSAPPAGQPPLAGGSADGFISANDAAVWEQVYQQYPWIRIAVTACAFAPVCQDAALTVAGAAVIGAAVGYGVASLQNYIHQAKKADLRTFNDAVRQIEKICGKNLSPDERRRLHDLLHSPSLGPSSFQDIVREGVGEFCPEKYDQVQ